MNNNRLKFLREHAATLERFAVETASRSDRDPGNLLLRAVAHNQRQCADEAASELRQALKDSVS
ncbi:hypothetical protein E4L96_18315 [Massilia arenosa]|uniref:Uncharacterized protein n=1 Tax=Zemynaea arenosa TaxID=2561931 RepID=A0A4Y9S214_9BURK|nr:hypothetical protein [Massilia arenosa]TFW15410.1 hypothetical protein E4L96_18315 [Massilia arenosa]